MKFSEIDRETRDLIDDYLDGTIRPGDFERLQDQMLENADLRAGMRRYLSLDHYLITEASDIRKADQGEFLWSTERPDNSDRGPKTSRFPSLVSLAVAAIVAFMLGSSIMYWSNSDREPASTTANATGSRLPSESTERFAKGFAVIENLFDVQWKKGRAGFLCGEVLGADSIHLESGTAEIQFFSGALMTVQGPAEISLKSAWEANCLEGAVRMKVPPAARGFKLHAPMTEIEDLGTEFGLVVRNGEGLVEVFDGEISVKHQGGDRQLITKGGALNLAPKGPAVPIDKGRVVVPDSSEFGDRIRGEAEDEFNAWRAHRDALANDLRLIAYYDFDRGGASTLIPNLTRPRKDEFDGAVVMAEPVSGRWPGLKSALEFRRPGARVRVNIPGEYPAFTFMCWVRIDSLDRQYNALFMGDGYETGEPHWQIRDDGKMMLSVMVDDSRPDPRHEGSKGHHRVYYSPSMWDLSLSGQWVHLTSVFDPENRMVSHFVNAGMISQQAIVDDYFIDRLRIGNAEIGNWGQPFREDPTFAIRNLNGRIDELAIFKSALTAGEIKSLFERSRSARH